MRLRHHTSTNVFYCESTFAEKDEVKGAGFWFHWGPGKCRKSGCNLCKHPELSKVWWTPHTSVANRLRENADDSALAALEDHQHEIEASKATDADVEIPAPEGLEYLPFQRAGINYAKTRSATLIGDEMGLGKTIQALGIVNADETAQNVLVIVPASLRINWKREAEKWLTREFNTYVVNNNDPIPEDATFVIANYDRIKGKVLDSLMNRTWDVLIVDECHKVKNPKAKRTQRILGWWNKARKARVPGIVDCAKKKVFMTGTPFLNRPIEIQPIAGALDRQFCNFFRFAKRYCNAHHNGYGWDFSGAANLAELQERLRSSIMVRRLKKDVLKELPSKRRQVVTLPANGAARVVKAEQKAFQAHEERLEELRQDADLAHAAGDKEAYDRAVAALKAGAQAAFTEISQLRHKVAMAKIEKAVEHVEEMLEATEKVVVFAHHHDVVEKLCAAFGNSAVRLTGQDSQDDRQQAVDRFQTDPNCRVFIGSIHAAGVGLTLTASSHVVFVELDWVPANVTQAEDRCHRIGQTDSVLVQHLVLDGSLDATMAQTLVEKQNLADQALDDSTQTYITPKEDPRPRKYPPVSDEVRKATTTCLQMLSGMCDGALAEDGVGFNKIDTRLGKVLAARSLDRDLTDGEIFLARKFIPKYRRQLPAELVELVQMRKAASNV